MSEAFPVTVSAQEISSRSPHPISRTFNSFFAESKTSFPEYVVSCTPSNAFVLTQNIPWFLGVNGLSLSLASGRV